MRGNPLISSENKFPIISIHASAWEATRLRVSDDCKQYNFNSRLCMRGNATVMKQQDKISAFQFTPLHERQRRRFVQFGISWIFQFTPLHERQLMLYLFLQVFPYFNSRLCMRGNCDFKQPLVLLLFQFTPLHERQPREALTSWARSYFNSRLCMRGNETSFTPSFLLFYFNSRLCMRGNFQKMMMTPFISYFNSRLCMRGNSNCYCNR